MLLFLFWRVGLLGNQSEMECICQGKGEERGEHVTEESESEGEGSSQMPPVPASKEDSSGAVD